MTTNTGTADRALLEAHLDACPTCPPLYASLVGARDALRSRDPDSVIDPAVLARLTAQLEPRGNGHRGAPEVS